MRTLRLLVPFFLPVSFITAANIPSYTRDTALEMSIGKDDGLPRPNTDSGIASWDSSPVTPSQHDEAATITRVESNEYDDKLAHSQDALSSGGAHVFAYPTRRQQSAVDVQRYAVVPKDGKDSAGANKTELFLQKLVGKKNLNKAFIWKEAVQWWACNMTSTQVENASKNEGVGSVEKIVKSTPMANIPSPCMAVMPTLPDKYSSPKSRRDGGLSTQKDAVTELVAVSQPSTVSDIKKLKNYVYDANSGNNSFIYHVGAGVNYKKHNDISSDREQEEFSNLVPDDEHLKISRLQGWDMPPWVDRSLNMHSTCTANKAVGTNYGVSKKAKMFVVKMFLQDSDEIIEALAAVFEDIQARPDRRKRSVVTMSMGLSERSPFWENKLSEAIRQLFKIDVPVFVPAGNEAGDPNRQHIDSYPALFAAFNFPLVVVGSANYDGSRSPFSQSGPHLTVHAVGNGVSCLPNDDNTPVSDQNGTSFAAPVVAAHAANLLSYDTVPFDTSDGDLVANLWNYLQSPGSSWARSPGVSMVWNGVQETNNSVDEPPIPEKQCTGVANKKYANRDTVVSNIQEFCPEAIKQGGPDPGSGSIGRVYSQGTVQQLSIVLDIPPGTPLPTEEACEANFLVIVDGCDVDLANPSNYKAGGQLSIGTIRYRVTPEKFRKTMYGAFGHWSFG